jgi:hypothetical protein
VLTECINSKGCAPAKHHFDECQERVTGQIESDGKAKEDCVEECKKLQSQLTPLFIPNNANQYSQSFTSLTAQPTAPHLSSSLSSSKPHIVLN